MSVTPGRSAATVAARLSLPGEGRYTFVFYDRATGAPLVQARGGRLGGRTLTRPTRAWSVTGVRAGAPVVLRARLAARRGTRIGLRVERRAPDGTRTVVRLGRTGPIG
jgi:hypothetical protein